MSSSAPTESVPLFNPGVPPASAPAGDPPASPAVSPPAVFAAVPAVTTPVPVHPAVKAATASGGIFGLVIALAGFFASALGHGSAAADVASILGGAGLSLGSIVGLVKHVDANAPAQAAGAQSVVSGVVKEADKIGPEVIAKLNELHNWWANRGGKGDIEALVTKVPGLEKRVTPVEDAVREVQDALGNDEDKIAELERTANAKVGALDPALEQRLQALEEKVAASPSSEAVVQAIKLLVPGAGGGGGVVSSGTDNASFTTGRQPPPPPPPPASATTPLPSSPAAPAAPAQRSPGTP